MTRKKTEVYILTVFLLLVAVYFGTREPWEKPAFSFVAVTESGAETLRPWHDGNGNGYVFLPSYVTLDQLQIRTTRPVFFGETKMTYGKSCEPFRLDTPYPLKGKTKALNNLTFLGSGNLPTLFLDTASDAMDAVHQDKTAKEGGDLRLYTADGALECRIGLDYIKGRGSSTFLYQDKKPYSLKLTSPQDLLGMGRADKWILLANAYDDSQLRNKIVYDFAARAGLPHSPESRFVDLYLNGEYAGLYQLCERNEIHPQRVDISPKGSFLVTVDRSWGTTDPIFYTESGISVRIRQSDLPEEQVRAVIQRVENAIEDPDHVDPTTGKHLTELIDLDSWVQKYLIEEVFSNTDGGRYSQFYYYDGEKVHAGPVWDYDLALSNPATYREFGDIGYRDSRYNMFYVKTNPDCWYYDLYQADFFQTRLREIYTQDFLPLLKDWKETLGTLEQQTAAAAHLNQIRWNTRNPAEEARFVEACITGRTEFLTEIWTENQEYIPVLARYVDRNIEYALKPGEPLSQLPDYPNYTWFYTDTEQIVDKNAPVTGPLNVELRENPQ